MNVVAAAVPPNVHVIVVMSAEVTVITVLAVVVFVSPAVNPPLVHAVVVAIVSVDAAVTM